MLYFNIPQKQPRKYLGANEVCEKLKTEMMKGCKINNYKANFAKY